MPGDEGDADRDIVTALPVPCLVVLVGPSSAGKSTWAAQQFAPAEVVSSDRLRAVVGRGEDDLDATDDAFAVLETIVAHRLRRGLTTVVDTLALDPGARARYRELAAAHDVPCVAVGFDVDAATCRARNRERPHPLPAAALKQQLARWSATRDGLEDEGFDQVLRPAPVRHVAAHLRSSEPMVAVQRDAPVGVRFGLHVSSFPWPAVAEGLRATAVAAEEAGFSSLWVMDHLRQIPQVGRDWDPMLECYSTLAWMAAVTTRVQLGALVSPLTFRNVAVLGKVLATVDVLSAGRAVCGLGLGWYEREHAAYGIELPATGDRYALLEDALQALPVLWGPGAKPFHGKVLTIPETIGYPRPLQDRIPILVGGGGERRTLRLAAQHADAVNLMGTADVVRRKVDVLHGHCRTVARDPATIAVTHLAPTLVGADRAELGALVEQLRPRQADPARFAAGVNAGTIEDQIGRVRELVEAGVDEVIVSFPDLGHPAAASPTAPIERFAEVIRSFAPAASPTASPR
jgi:alkanesulfonate monooxygenase SsuD/methylene tetrahydromethanopterin reductase-like flavin-dependent oxidoreductase (luciferase family)